MKRLIVALLFLPLLACASITSTVDKTGPTVISGSPQTIPVGFPFQTSAGLVVLDTGALGAGHDPATVLTLGSDYTVTGGGYNGSNQMQVGSIVVVSTGTHSVQVGDYITVMRGVTINQTSSFTTNGPTTLQLLEQALDKNATLAQQVNEIGGRSLQFENFESLSPVLSLSSRKGMVLGFDGTTGAVSFVPNSTLGATLVTSATGTANQVLVNATSGSAQSGALTFTLPQDIGTASNPSFASVTATSATTTATNRTITKNDLNTSLNTISYGSTAVGSYLGTTKAGSVFLAADGGTAAPFFVIGTAQNTPINFAINGSGIGGMTSTGLNNMVIGATTPLAGGFTSITSASGGITATRTDGGYQFTTNSASESYGIATVGTSLLIDDRTAGATRLSFDSAGNLSLPHLTTNGVLNTTGGTGATTVIAAGANGTFLGYSGGVLGYYTPAGGGNVSNTGTPVASTDGDTVFDSLAATFNELGGALVPAGCTARLLDALDQAVS
jgi:hypothetical protein